MSPIFSSPGQPYLRRSVIVLGLVLLVLDARPGHADRRSQPPSVPIGSTSPISTLVAQRRSQASTCSLSRWMLGSMGLKTCRALKRLIASSERGAATFDADGTLWKDDVGEGFYRWMMDNRFYPADRRPALERAWQHYQASGDGDEMYKLMVTSMAGMTESHVARLSNLYFDQQHKTSIYRPMALLVSALGHTGFTPWVVSGSPYWVVAAGARHFQIPPSRVIGLRVKVVNGVLTDQLELPVPWQRGKREAILQRLGGPPTAAFGNSGGDREMLSYARRAFAINPDAGLRPYIRNTWYVSHFSIADTLDGWLRPPKPKKSSSRQLPPVWPSTTNPI